MSDRTEFLDPEFEPGEFDRVERQLRASLVDEARRVQPHDRLEAILHEAHAAGPAADEGHGRRWLLPVAAAAAVAAIIGGTWWATQGDPGTPTPPVGTTGPQTSAPSAPSGTSAPSAASSSSTTASTTATAPVTLPVYYVGPQGDPEGTPKLFREFLRRDLPAGLSVEAKVAAALIEAVDAQQFSNTDGYLQPWSGQMVNDVQVTAKGITVDLDNAGNPDAAVTPEVRRLAVQQLVWTAQAVVQKGNLPVRFTVQGEAKPLFGTIATTGTFTRPSSDELWQDLAPIWITAPTRDQVLPAGKPVTAKGLAIVFEANVNWQLKRGSTQVATGHATASAGAPAQGEYSIPLGTLEPGSYTLRVFEMSMKDGDSVHAEKSVSFTVR